MLKIYGIKHCDTMKKTFAWCEAHGLPYEFHDYKKSGVPQERLREWCRRLGWQRLLNTRGPTWRKLAAAGQAASDENAALALMLAYPSVIRRPLIETPTGELVLGFDEAQLAALLR